MIERIRFASQKPYKPLIIKLFMKKNYLFLLLLMTSYANAAIIYVNKNATGANNGSSWTNAYTTIEAAFANSVRIQTKVNFS